MCPPLFNIQCGTRDMVIISTDASFPSKQPSASERWALSRRICNQTLATGRICMGDLEGIPLAFLAT
jgi:hypothetical protein